MNVDGLVDRDLSQASNGTGSEATGEVLLTAVGAMRAAGPTGGKCPLRVCDAKKIAKIAEPRRHFQPLGFVAARAFSGTLLLQEQ